jgi:hypothetical protein
MSDCGLSSLAVGRGGPVLEKAFAVGVSVWLAVDGASVVGAALELRESSELAGGAGIVEGS